MPQGAIPRRYAEAAFALAREKGNLQRWRTDLRTAAALLGGGQISVMLQDPNVALEHKKKFIDDALTIDVDPLVRNLIYLLAQRNRIGLLDRIAEEFVTMTNKELGIVVAEVTTAVALNDSQQKKVADRIKQMTGAKQVELRNKVDPRIIAGMVARIGDELYDGSVRSRLSDLAERLS